MDIHKRIDKRNQNNKVGIKWSPLEDKVMYDAVKQMGRLGGRSFWKRVAELTQRSIPKFKRSAEQCMRRYKNYLNPSCYTSSWRAGQGMFLMVLHAVHGQNWTEIGHILREKNVVTLSEYFYDYMHKTIRNASEGHVPLALMEQPTCLWEACYVLDLLQYTYVPSFSVAGARPGDGQGADVLAWLRQHEITTGQLVAYRKLLFDKFSEQHRDGQLPISIVIDLDKAQIFGLDADLLRRNEEKLNFSAQLNELTTIRLESSAILSGTKAQTVPAAPASKPVEEEQKSMLVFNFPVYRSMLPLFLGKRPPGSDFAVMYPPPVYPIPVPPGPAARMQSTTHHATNKPAGESATEPVWKKKRHDADESS